MKSSIGIQTPNICMRFFTVSIFYFNFMTYIHVYQHITITLERKLKAYLFSSPDNIQLHKCNDAYSISGVKRANWQKENIVSRKQIMITPSCNFYSFLKLKYRFYSVKEYQHLLIRYSLVIITKTCTRIEKYWRF